MYQGMDWWMKEEEKKNNYRESNDIALINRQLQEVLHGIESEIDPNKYLKEAEQAERPLIQCSIWAINYINNMENPRVALIQGLFISFIIERENELTDRTYLLEKVDTLMRQLGNVDWPLYLEYEEFKGRIVVS